MDVCLSVCLSVTITVLYEVKDRSRRELEGYIPHLSPLTLMFYVSMFVSFASFQTKFLKFSRKPMPPDRFIVLPPSTVACL